MQNEQIIAAIITGVFSVLATIIGIFLVNRKTKNTPKKQIIRLDGKAQVFMRVKDTRTAEHEGHTNQEQKLQNGILTISGENATFKADFSLKETPGRSINGKITASGSFHNNTAFMHHKIEDSGSNQVWHGVLVFRIPGMGKITAQYLSDSSKVPGSLSLGHMVFVRRN